MPEGGGRLKMKRKLPKGRVVTRKLYRKKYAYTDSFVWILYMNNKRLANLSHTDTIKFYGITPRPGQSIALSIRKEQ